MKEGVKSNIGMHKVQFSYYTHVKCSQKKSNENRNMLNTSQYSVLLIQWNDYVLMFYIYSLNYYGKGRRPKQKQYLGAKAGFIIR